MAIIIPERKYFTFGELLQRWQCTSNDLRYLIVNGELKPAIKAVAPMTVWSICTSEDDGLVGGDLEDVDGQPVMTFPQGWLYLQRPRHKGALDCEFAFATHMRDPQPLSSSSEPHWGSDSWFRPSPYVTMEKVENRAAFLLEEVLRYERAQDKEPDAVALERPIGTRERDTLLTVIAALCQEAKLDYSKPSKTAGLIQSIAAGMGISIGETTIEGHLKRIPDALATRMK